MQMFTPSRKNEPPAPVAPATPPRPASPPPSPASNSSNRRLGGVLSNGVTIVGQLKFGEELEIDCEVEGSIDSQGRLTVGKNARIRGDINTRSVVVLGTVEGNINVTERCELRAGCTLHGDIEAPRLVVDDDATFMGSAKITSKGRAKTE